MNQPMGNNQYGGGYRPPQKKQEQNIVLWICIGLFAVVLIAGTLFIGIFLLTNHLEARKALQETPAVVQVSPATETATPTPTPTPVPTVGGNSYYYDHNVYFVNAFTNSGIYVRTEASKQSSKLLYIAQGDTNVRLRYLDETISYDPVDNKNYVWYMVETPNGTVGYVRSDVVRQW